MESHYGHDAFLLEREKMEGIIAAFLASGAKSYTPLRAQLRRPAEGGRRRRVMRRIDYKLIEDLVPDGSTVLDLACGDGELLSELIAHKHVRGSGVEIDQAAVEKCIGRGLSVFHGDLDAGLADFDDQSHRRRHPEPQPAATSPAPDDSARDGPRRPPCHRELPELRPLGPARAAVACAGACRSRVTSAASVVGHAQHPSVHGQDFRALCREEGLCIEQEQYLLSVEKPPPARLVAPNLLGAHRRLFVVTRC